MQLSLILPVEGWRFIVSCSISACFHFKPIKYPVKIPLNHHKMVVNKLQLGDETCGMSIREWRVQVFRHQWCILQFVLGRLCQCGNGANWKPTMTVCWNVLNDVALEKTWVWSAAWNEQRTSLSAVFPKKMTLSFSLEFYFLQGFHEFRLFLGLLAGSTGSGHEAERGWVAGTARARVLECFGAPKVAKNYEVHSQYTP